MPGLRPRLSKAVTANVVFYRLIHVIILKNAVESRKSTQHLEAPDKIKNTLFTNQVITVFLI
jgi:hypothetical protein